MYEDFLKKYSKAPSSSTAKRQAPASPYGVHELRTIGQQCSKRLPPASTMQAMFMYEMERASEQEALFNHTLFRMAKQEGDFTSHQRRVEHLESHIDGLRSALSRLTKQADDASSVQQKGLQALDGRVTELATLYQSTRRGEDAATHERIQTVEAGLVELWRLILSEPRADDSISKQQQVQKLEDKLDSCVGRIDLLEGKMEAMETHVSRIAQVVTDLRRGKNAAPTNMVELREELGGLSKNHDSMSTMLKEAKAQIARLEENVRALTLQGTANRSPTTSPPHVLDVQTSNGEPSHLSVPKGNPYVALTENRTTRSFGPGKPWAQ